MKTMSIVVPCYNEKDSLNAFYDETESILKGMKVEYKYIFVDDGSTDETLLVIKKLAKNKNVNFISFSRNFGKEGAILAGLKKSDSDYTVLMDADLQHDPNILPKMFDLITNDKYDFVATRRIDRKGENKIISFFSSLFYKVINRFSDINLHSGVQDYRIMTNQVTKSVINMHEYNRFSKGLFNWVGFNGYYIEVENRERIAGKSSWDFFKLFKYAIDGITSFTISPLRFATLMGVITSFASLVYLIYVLVKTLVVGEAVPGFPTLIILILFLSSIQLIALGIIGEYLSKTYLEVKKRPSYIIKEESQ